MPRDFKTRPRKRPTAKPKAVRRWPSFVAGVVLGAVVSWGFFGRDFAAERLRGAVTQTVTEGIQGGAPRRESEPVRPRFEFYTMLPEMEVAVPEEELEREPARAQPAQPDARAGTRYMLQVGSFRKLAEAESLKAKLAFLGLEAGIQTVTINGEVTWHRVRVGPYTDVAVLNEARARLRENQYRVLVLKIRS